MTDDREQDPDSRRPRRGIRLTVGLLGALAALIYLGFISRGVLG